MGHPLGGMIRPIKERSAAFGLESDAEWRRFVEVAVRRREDGGYEMNHDPEIAWALHEQPPREIEFWELWDPIVCPVLLIRGAESDLLTARTAREMQERGPGCALVEIPGTGHCPMLMNDHQIGLVADFLNV